MATEVCKIGVSLNEESECHKQTWCRKTGLINISDIAPDDRSTLSWRCGVSFKEEDQICLHHEKVYLTRFESLQRSCADPLSRHKKLITRTIGDINRPAMSGSFDESSSLYVEQPSPTNGDSKDDVFVGKLSEDSHDSGSSSAASTPKKSTLGSFSPSKPKKSAKGLTGLLTRAKEGAAKKSKSVFKSPLAKSPSKSVTKTLAKALSKSSGKSSSKSSSRSKSPSLLPPESSTEEEPSSHEAKFDEDSEEWRAFQEMQERIKQTVQKTRNNLTKLALTTVADCPEGGAKSHSAGDSWVSFDGAQGERRLTDIDIDVITNDQLDLSWAAYEEDGGCDLIEIDEDLPHLSVSPIPSPRILPKVPSNSLRTSREDLSKSELVATENMNLNPSSDMDLLGLGDDSALQTSTTSASSDTRLNQDLLGLGIDVSAEYPSPQVAPDLMCAPIQARHLSAATELLFNSVSDCVKSSRGSSPLAFGSDFLGGPEKQPKEESSASQLANSIMDDFLSLNEESQQVCEVKTLDTTELFDPFKTITDNGNGHPSPQHGSETVASATNPFNIDTTNTDITSEAISEAPNPWFSQTIEDVNDTPFENTSKFTSDFLSSSGGISAAVMQLVVAPEPARPDPFIVTSDTNTTSSDPFIMDSVEQKNSNPFSSATQSETFAFGNQNQSETVATDPFGLSNLNQPETNSSDPFGFGSENQSETTATADPFGIGNRIQSETTAATDPFGLGNQNKSETMATDPFGFTIQADKSASDPFGITSLSGTGSPDLFGISTPSEKDTSDAFATASIPDHTVLDPFAGSSDKQTVVTEPFSTNVNSCRVSSDDTKDVLGQIVKPAQNFDEDFLEKVAPIADSVNAFDAWGLGDNTLDSGSINPFMDNSSAFTVADDDPFSAQVDVNKNPFLSDDFAAMSSETIISSNPFLEAKSETETNESQAPTGDVSAFLFDSGNTDTFDPFGVHSAQPSQTADGEPVSMFEAVSATGDNQLVEPGDDVEFEDEDDMIKVEIKPMGRKPAGKAPPIPPPPKPSAMPLRENPFDRDSPPEEEFAKFEVSKEETRTRPPREATMSISTESSTPDDEEPPGPLERFRPKFEGNGWHLMLRQPTKKKLTGNRYWKNVFVKLVQLKEGPALKIYADEGEREAFHELPLQPCYSLSEIALQQYDQYGKIHTMKLQYIFYRERVGLRAERITPNFVRKPKPTMILDHTPQVSELLKFGSLKKDYLKFFTWELDDALMNLEAHRDKTLSYTKDEMTVDVWDEYECVINKGGHIERQKSRVRIFCLAFVTGMPSCELGVNDRRRKGREVVGRHDIIPVKTEDWIRIQDYEFHCVVDQTEFEKSNTIRFHPLDGCQFEIMRFRARPKENKELPLHAKIKQHIKGMHVEIRCDLLVTGYHANSKKHGQFPCEDIEIHFPIPETWIYLFRYERRFGYGSFHAAARKPGKIKGLERLTMIAQGNLAPALMEASVGTAKYENVYKAVVWRINRLPERNEGAYKNHLFVLKMDLGPHDEIPETFEQYSEVEFTMPSSTVSKTQVRSISVANPNPPEKWVRYTGKYQMKVEIQHSRSAETEDEHSD